MRDRLIGLLEAVFIPLLALLAAAVLFGPGDLRVAHAADEFVDIADVATCAAVLTDWVRKSSLR